jgi:hypothetical protein
MSPSANSGGDLQNMIVKDNLSTFLKGKPVFRKAQTVQAAEQLTNKVKQNGMWPTIDFMIAVWEKNYPERARAFSEQQKDTVSTRRSETGSSKSLTYRYLCEIPQEIMNGIDFFFMKEVSADKKKFYREFAHRYPQFRVAQKI